MSDPKPKDLLDIIQRKWNSPIGLLAACIVNFGFLSVLFANFEIVKTIKFILFIVVFLAITVLWLESRKLPKVKKGKIGFVVHFKCSNERDQINFKEDFIEHLQKLIKNSAAGKSIQFIDISKKLPKSIVDQDDAQWLRAKTRAHFVLYGQLKKRMVKGEHTYVLSMDGLVAHRPISNELSKSMAIEFAELLPRKILIKSNDDIFNFEFTSTWAGYVAKYIIAIAAAISFDFKYSELLLTELKQSLINMKIDFPIILKLQNLVIQRIAELDILQAKINYEAWRKNHEDALIKVVGKHLDRIPESQRHNYEYINSKAIYHFLDKRDVNSAIETLKECKKIEHPTWHMNLAFLYAYSENLYDAIRQYKIATEYTMEPELISQIEEFLCWCIDTEPDKYQLNYLLGYFNWQVKGDLKQALEDFNNFLKQRQKDKFEKEKEIGEDWIKQIKAVK